MKIDKKETKVHLTADGILVIDGKEYVESINKIKEIDGIEHIDKILYREFDRKGFEKKINFIAETISETLDKDLLIKELVKGKSLNEINKIYDVLKGKKKKKITVQKGCVGIKIGSGKSKSGGIYFQLIN